VLFLITFVTSIPALLLYQPVLKHVHYIVGGGACSPTNRDGLTRAVADFAPPPR